MPGPAASTIRMIERMWPENVDSDWAIDCSSPMSAKTSRKTGRRLPACRRDVQAGLVHQREQPERAQRHGLAAGVRAGHDERREAVAEADVDRDDAAGQARVPRREQLHLRALRRLGPGRAHLARELRLGRPEVEPGEGVERLAQRPDVRADQRGQLVEDPLDLLLLGELRLAPGVAELDDDERLDEQRLAAPGRVVDDALDPALRLGLHGHDVAPVPERDDRLLERAAELDRADEGVEPALQPVERDADRGPQAAEPRRGRVEQLARRVERARERRGDRRAAGAGPDRGRGAAAGARRRGAA